MKEIKVIKTINLYNFNELDDNIKHKIIDEYIEERNMDIDLEEILNFDICENFSNFVDNTLRIAYSLSYSQGDGVSFTGTLDIEDFINKHKNYIDKHFSKKYLEKLISVKNEIGDFIKISRINSFYVHKNTTCIKVIEDFNNIDFDYSFLVKTEELMLYIQQEYSDICDNLETTGYNYFYKVNEEELEEMQDKNNFYDNNGEKYTLNELNYCIIEN